MAERRMTTPADAPGATTRLSRGPFATVVGAAGGGWSALGDFALTRWAPDRTRDADGVWLYVRDAETGAYWSAGLQPVPRDPDAYRATLGDRQATLVRRDGDLEVTTEVCVAPEGDAELRRYTITNHGGRPRRLELTTYVEAVLNSPMGDWSHPAFSKLFVQTAWDAVLGALVAKRRLRSPDDEPLWVVHRLVGDDGAATEHETDRMRFVGRGRTTANPKALETGGTLSGTVGPVLDPVLCLRTPVVVAPGATARVLAVLGAAHEEAAAHAVARRYATAADADTAFAEAGRGGEGETVRPPVAAATKPRFEPTTAGAANLTRGDVPADEELLRFNGHGGFSADGTEYVIRVRDGARDDALPPLPWVNVVANETVGFIASERGSSHTWAANSRENRVTPWYNDPVSDPHGEALWLRDEEAGTFWSPTPGPVPGAGGYEVRHGFGYTIWRHAGMELEQEVVQFVPRRDPVKLTVVRVVNRSGRPRRLSLASYAQLVLGVHPHVSASHVETEAGDGGAILARNADRGEFSERVAFAALVAPAGAGDVERTADRHAFLGPLGSVADPAALRTGEPLSGAVGEGLDPCAAFRATFDLAPGASVECVVLLGEAADEAEARAVLGRYHDARAAGAALEEAREFWTELVTRLQVETPSPEIDLMVNGWLTYQNLSCRMWGRSAFYQSGGAFGFRDQLQDSSALIYLLPELTRRQIVLHASHQFVEGDVLHWWHPPLSKGMRTRFADDLLWLPYIAAFYVRTTGDAGVLDEPARFVTARLLAPGEDEAFVVPEDAGTSASVYEHCCLSIDRSLKVGAHGLPLMGVGDWNDGMNRVGREGRGESVWLGFFLYDILVAFLPHVERRGDAVRLERYRVHLAHLARALNDGGWDGAWYRRAYYDDGAPLGAAENDECRIDTIAQAWSVLSGAAPAGRAEQALDAMERHLVSEREGIIRLLTPAFDRTPHDPGYIKGYLPGVRENGGQYTHGALWGVRALAEAGRAERAAPLLEMLSPVSHGRTGDEVATYMTEPYVVAADVYGVEPHVGRGGWTWYTGSAGWLYRVALESVLGLRMEGGDRLVLRPCIPAVWPGFTITYRLPGDDGTTYELVVGRAKGSETRVSGGGEASVQDGAVIVSLRRDGGTHRVEIALGSDVGPRYVPRVEET